LVLNDDFSFGTLKLEENSLGVSVAGIIGLPFLFKLLFSWATITFMEGKTNKIISKKHVNFKVIKKKKKYLSEYS